MTADFADDIEKLRNANDFKESSVPVLIQALKQGAAGFTEEEKKMVMNGMKGQGEKERGQEVQKRKRTSQDRW